MPTTILASDYNTERDYVNLVLGIAATGSTPTYGYGQSFTTNGVLGTRANAANPSAASKVTAQNYQDLYIDLIRARAHQVGSAQAISDFVVGDYDTNTATADKIEAAYLAGLQALRTNISTDRFLVDPPNLSVTALTNGSSVRPSGSAWNGSISHILTMSFTSHAARCHFFNSGGQIRFAASVGYTGSQAKTVDWQTILNSMGTTSFKAQSTNNNASVGTDSNIGNYGLTNSYQLLYTRDGGSVYANNEYRIYAANLSSTVITFKVEFVDGSANDPSYGIDETVYGQFNSTIQSARANSTININGTVYNGVIIETDPIAANIRNLS